MAVAQFSTDSIKEAPPEVVSGDTFTYTIVVVNSDVFSDALSTSVSDTLPIGDVSYIPDTLTATVGIVTPTASSIAWSGVVSAGGRVTITFGVTATALPGEVITNSAVISDPTLSTPVTVTAVTRMALPNLSSSAKTAPPEIAPGYTFTYTIVVVNSSLISDALSTSVSDTLPGGVSYIPGTLTATAGIVTPTASSIAWSGVVSASARVTITFGVTATALLGEVITNSAVISDAALSAPVTKTAVTQVAGPNLSSLSRKTSSSDRLPEGEQAIYTIVVVNSGPKDAVQATLSDEIPTGTVYVTDTAWASSGVVTGTATAIEWSGAVTAGHVVTVTFGVSVTASPDEIITNTAIISDVELMAPVVISVTNPVIPYVDFEFSKVVTPTIVEPGGALTYTLRFTNTGRYTTTGTSLVDLIPDNTTYNNDATSSQSVLISSTTAITWTDAGDLLVGEGVVISFSVRVSDTYHGFITNTATISQFYLLQPLVRQVVVTGTPVLVIEKSDAPDPVGPGKLLDYELTVKNEGSIASGLLITDRLPMSTPFHSSGGTFVTSTGVISWAPPFTLPTGAWATFTFTVQVSPTVVSGTVIFNDDYRVSSDEGAWTAGELVETQVLDPILSITKGADPNPPGANRELTYEVRVRNTGSLATDLLITDVVPSNVTYFTGGTYISATREVTWAWPSLAHDASQVFSYQVSVGGLFSGTEIVNGGYDVSCAEGIMATGGPLTLTIQPPILETSYKYSDPIAAKPGGLVDYIVVIHNSGASSAIGATMTDTFPVNVAGFEVCTATVGIFVTCQNVSGVSTVEWNGDILHDQTICITLTTKINPGQNEGDLINTAYITDDLLSATAVVTTAAFVTNDPFLKVTKTDIPDPVAPGRFITYTITVQNVGLPTDDAVVLTDTVPGGTTYFGSDGSYITATNVVSWSLPKLGPGDSVQHLLVVQVGDVPSGTLVYNDDYGANCGTCAPAQGITVTTLVQLPLQASKRVTPGLALAGGESLTFTISVENVLGVTATNTMISDAIPANTIYVGGSLSYPPTGTASSEAAILANGYFTWAGDIPPYDTVDLAFQTTISSSFNFGRITNTAIISHVHLYRPLTATAVAIVSTIPILELDKVPAVSTVEPLHTLTYTLWLTNSGYEATDLVVTDTVPVSTTYFDSNGMIMPTNVVSWTWDSLGFGQGVSFTLVVSVSNVPSGTHIVNRDYAATCFEGENGVGEAITTTVYVPVLPPDVVAVSPDTIPNLSPQAVVITGTNFISPVTVYLGTTPPTPLTVINVSPTWIEAVVPAGLAPGLYDLTVVNPGSGDLSDVLPNAITVTNALDHFVFSTILTQTVDVAFNVVITAEDAFGWIVTTYVGSAALSDSTGTLVPNTTPNFVAGVVNVSVTINRAQNNVTITAQDGPQGTSNPFNVVSGEYYIFLPLVVRNS